MKIKKRKSAEPKSVQDLRKQLKKYAEAKAVASEQSNAANREKTATKNAIRAAVLDSGGKDFDSIIVDGVAYAFRPNETTEIDPRTWHDWYTKGKISDNQYFIALKVSVADASKAIGSDQIPDVSFTTLTATADMRSEDAPNEPTGKIKPFLGAEIKTAKELKAKKTSGAETGIAPTTTKPKIKTRKIRV